MRRKMRTGLFEFDQIRTKGKEAEAFKQFFGNKILRLVELKENGFLIPKSFVLFLSVGEPETRLKKLWRSDLLRLQWENGGIARSSAPDEDSKNTFAGVYESCVFHWNEEDFIKAVSTVLASYQSGRALKYKEKSDLPLEEATKYAVLVQEYIVPQCSGVIYTYDPIHQNDNCVIESVWGENTGITGGQVIPDLVIYDQKQGEYVMKEKGNGGQEEFSMDTGQVIELVRQAKKLEQLLGAPQDIEWAYQAGELYILQSRDIRMKNNY